MYVCMHACMHACMYVCMYVCMHACIHACMHACMYVCMYVYIYIYIYVYIYVYIHLRSTAAIPSGARGCSAGAATSAAATGLTAPHFRKQATKKPSVSYSCGQTLSEPCRPGARATPRSPATSSALAAGCVSSSQPHCASFSCSFQVHVEYTSTPPGLRARHALAMRARCTSRRGARSDATLGESQWAWGATILMFVFNVYLLI